MRASFIWVSATLTIFTLSACSGSGVKPGVYPHPAPGLAEMELAQPGWSPETVEIECHVKEGCPQQVGMLIFVFPERNGKIPFSKCTAFLSAADQITSNGHCDQTQTGAQGYFVLPGTPHQVRRISRVLQKQFSPGERGRDSGRPDIGIFELEKPIRSVEPLFFANLRDPEFNQIYAFVINNGTSNRHFVVNRIACHIQRHEALFPYDLKENPDVITAFSCSTVRGNSGGPVFAPGSPAVQGVLQGTSERERKRQVVLEKLRRPLHSYEEHDSITLSNLRCAGANRSKCVPVELARSQSRFSDVQLRVAEGLNRRPPPASATDGIRFKAIAFQTQESDKLRFEIFYQPVCFEGHIPPNQIAVPLEFVNLAFDEWAMLKPEVVETRMAYFELASGAAGRISVRAQWPAPFAELRNSTQHPRRIWGPAFSIELPTCPR